MDSSSVEEQLDLCAEAGIEMIRDECLWSDVRIDILDLRGSVVASPLNSFHSPGDHYLDLDMQSLSSGIYIYRLTTPYLTLNRKFAYIK